MMSFQGVAAKLHCKFCQKTGLLEYRTHNFQDKFKRLTCPNLRKRVCPTCHATGDNAHTNSHCPIKLREKKRDQINLLANFKE